MRAPYGLKILDNCVICPVREKHLFCNLPLPALQKLNEIKSTAIYPKSTMLFIEGQQPCGVFILCSGKAPPPPVKVRLSLPGSVKSEMQAVSLASVGLGFKNR